MSTIDFPGNDALCKLLPWYANGTLEGEEMSQFEGHLEQCEHCQAELPLLLDLARAQQAGADVVQALQRAEQSSLANLMGQLEQPKTSSTSLMDYFNFAQRPKSLAAIVSTALALLIMPIIASQWFSSAAEPAHYELLTSHAANDLHRLQVVMHTDHNLQTLAPLLAEYEPYSIEQVSDGIYILGFDNSDAISGAKQRLSVSDSVRWLSEER